jgi:hypothetical protein
MVSSAVGRGRHHGTRHLCRLASHALEHLVLSSVTGEIVDDLLSDRGLDERHRGPRRIRPPAYPGDGIAAMTPASYDRDPRVDEYIDGLPDWQQAICNEVRDLVHAADPEVEETIKRKVQPYFVLQGNICALLATKDHVNVFLYDGGIVPDPEGIITGGHDNKTARTVAVYEDEQVNATALRTMFEQIIANNRAGGWRRLKRES